VAAAVPRILACAADEMFRGKSLRLLVGTTPGAGYDLMRGSGTCPQPLVPGNPSVVVENMPGAGSLAMMNYLLHRRRATARSWPAAERRLARADG
jgi:hypothetical protein